MFFMDNNILATGASTQFYCNAPLSRVEVVASILGEAGLGEENYMLSRAGAQLQRVCTLFWREIAERHMCLPTIKYGQFYCVRRLADSVYITAPRNPATWEAAHYGAQRACVAFGDFARTFRHLHGASQQAARQAARAVVQWIASAEVLESMYFPG